MEEHDVWSNYYQEIGARGQMKTKACNSLQKRTQLGTYTQNASKATFTYAMERCKQSPTHHKMIPIQQII